MNHIITNARALFLATYGQEAKAKALAEIEAAKAQDVDLGGGESHLALA